MLPRYCTAPLEAAWIWPVRGAADREEPPEDGDRGPERLRKEHLSWMHCRWCWASPGWFAIWQSMTSLAAARLRAIGSRCPRSSIWSCSPVRPRGTRRSRPVDLNEVRRKQTPERRDVMMQVRGVPSGFRLDELIVTSIRRSSRVACRPRCRPGHERHEQTVRFGISDLRTTGPIRT
jgi:hypothetical protein